MSSIELTPSELQVLAGRLRGCARDIADVERSTAAALAIPGWSGAHRAEAERMTARTQARLRRVVTTAESLAAWLDRIAEGFEAADRQGISALERVASKYKDLLAWGSIAVGAVGSAASFLSSPWLADESDGADIDLPQDVVRAAKLLKMVRVIDGPVAKKVPIVGGVVRFWSDPDPDRWRAAGTSLVEGFIDKSLLLALPVGTVVVGADLILQLFGEAVEFNASMASRVYGPEYSDEFSKLSGSLDDNFDRIALSNWERGWGHVAYDLFTDPSRVEEDLRGIGEYMVQLPGGLLDTGSDVVHYGYLRTRAEYESLVDLIDDSKTQEVIWEVGSTAYEVAELAANMVTPGPFMGGPTIVGPGSSTGWNPQVNGFSLFPQLLERQAR